MLFAAAMPLDTPCFGVIICYSAMLMMLMRYYYALMLRHAAALLKPLDAA